MKSNQTSFRGLIHIHTTFSYDGTLSLPDFAELAKSRRFDFIIPTEHAEDFDDAKMQALVKACTSASHDDFLIIPGLEFNINNEVHILAIGIENFIEEIDPEELIQKIHEQNGLAILAHTAEYRKRIPYKKLRDIDFIEIWNPRYGERLSPSIKSIKILREFRKMKKAYYASGGLDVHKREDITSLYQVVFSPRFNQREILDSLKRGEFITTNGVIELPSLQDPSITMTAFIYLFAFVQFIPNMSKKIIRKISKLYKRRLANNF